MSEQSSVVVAFRALVMLGCLIVIPLAALKGSSLPAVAKAICQGRLPTVAELWGNAEPQPSASSEAPRFIAAAAADDAGHSGPATPANVPGPREGDSSVVAARYDAPLTAPDKDGRLSPAPSATERSPGLKPFPADSPRLLPVGPAKPSGSDPYAAVQDRLRQLGATYYFLESWGDSERQFRFYCRMAVGGNTRYTRQFWSIDNDPYKAMAQVLEEVEAWRAGGP